MQEDRVATGEAPAVYLEVDGNLRLSGWQKAEVLAQTRDDAALTVTAQPDGVRVTCDADCRVRVPLAATVHLVQAGGHVRVRRLEGAIHAQTVSGHLTLSNIGAATVERVEGHCTAEDVAGDLTLGAVEGHLTVHTLHGALRVAEQVEGHLALREVFGPVEVSAEGHGRLLLDPQPGQHVRVAVDGNLHCVLPPEADAVVEVQAGERLQVRLPEGEPPQGQAATLTLGAGQAQVHLSAGGSLLLQTATPFGESGWEGFGERLGEEIAARFSHLGPEIAERVQQRVEARLSEVEERLHGGWRGMSWSFDVPRRGPRRRPRRRWQRTSAARQAAGEEEIRLILDMLAEGKITVEEADRLLRALEGEG